MNEKASRYLLFSSGERLYAVDLDTVDEISEILPEYPMTIAVMAKDNADPKTGMEYANTNIGDAGFILKFGDGTVTTTDIAAGTVDGTDLNPNISITTGGVTVPASGDRRPISVSSKAVFPDRAGPTMPKISPAWTSKSTPSSTTCSPNRFLTPWSSIIS